jgi:hypothetical protein
LLAYRTADGDGAHTIKCDWDKPHPRFHAKQLVNHRAGRIDPTREAEITQSWKNKVWKPVPGKGDAAGDSEECIARDLLGVVAMRKRVNSLYRGSEKAAK